MPLRETYSQAGIHQRWTSAYRRNPAQLAFDNEIYDYLFRTLKPAGTWVDAGCGSGERTVQLARRCSAVIAVDISPDIQTAAKALAESEGLGGKIEFRCSPLEQLADIQAGNVHCRGVLMHIPDWRTCLENLCRIVVPGGYLVLSEGNCRSLEALAARLGHRLKKRASKIADTEGGLEFWSEIDGNPFLVRMADLDRVTREAMSQGFEPVLRRPVQFMDLYRFPEWLRRAVIWINRIWFRLGLPFGSGVMLVARKKTA